jgi:hypothetical protein
MISCSNANIVHILSLVLLTLRLLRNISAPASVSSLLAVTICLTVVNSAAVCAGYVTLLQLPVM